ncbi:hypothetical protein [Deinococcus puniceus]|uniref:hypothetical protein n=1 Tax=Deinococcus puniceus TaxID=1182568 RepID=UPI0007C91B74|nr:hypothetical protein [Deinococcus puniceus]
MLNLPRPFAGLLLAALSSAALSTASAAGILGTRDSFYNSPFCRQYSCSEPYRNGQNWIYNLNTGDRAFIRRENDDAQGRIELMAIFIDEDAFYAETDRATFANLQRTAIGYAAFTGRIEPCYGATSERLLSSYPAPNARSILCVRDGGQTAIALLADLTYTNYSAPAPARAATTTNNAALKLLDWSFTSCRSNRGVTAYLPLGEGAACTLRVNTVPNGRRLISASFEYELEYYVGGATAKLRLPGRDTYAVGGGGNVKLAQQGGSFSFTLPLNVRARADRRYVRVGAIGTLVFDDGTSKKVYEPLDIR